jgi:hypothetical protein
MSADPTTRKATSTGSPRAAPTGSRNALANPGRISSHPQPASHVLQRAIAIDRLRLFYAPVPKAGCTALLWSLAGLARLQESSFRDSAGREVTRALAIHDLSRWPASMRFGERSQEERERLLRADDWLRFTLVRHPFRRLWSAWQSKILLAEPQFIARYSSEPWFPGLVKSGADVLKAFREFLDAIENDPSLLRTDVHWAPQTDVIEYAHVPYDHVGQVEKLGETLDRIRHHLREDKSAVVPEPPHTNVSTLPYTDQLFTERDIRFLGEMYAEDMQLFGYEPPQADTLGDAVPESWKAMVDALIPALEELRHRNERVADLHQVARAKQRNVRELERAKKREEKLRREEHRRTERLQKRLGGAMDQLQRKRDQLQRIRDSRTWRYTALFRRVGSRFRRTKRALRGQH